MLLDYNWLRLQKIKAELNKRGNISDTYGKCLLSDKETENIWNDWNLYKGDSLSIKCVAFDKYVHIDWETLPQS